MIYTNNQREKNWVFNIKKYFENKINNNLFDQIICAFKINGKQIELCRSSHTKTHHDFIKCTKLPLNTQICFIDDTYFPEMHPNEVYYIKIKPYVYCLSITSIINRLKKSNLLDKIFELDKLLELNKYDFLNFLEEKLKEKNGYNKSKSMKEYEIDKIITKEIMNQIDSFFNNNQDCSVINYNTINRTKKNISYKNKTLKIKFF